MRFVRRSPPPIPSAQGSDLVTGLNTDVERHGRSFHVQTEGVGEPDPVVQSLIYSGGQILVRMTATFGEVTERFRLSGDDVRHVLELQHWNLVRKVQRGMLDDDDDPAPTARPPRRPEQRWDAVPSEVEIECDDPAVRELLDQLDKRIHQARAAAIAPPPAVRESTESATPARSTFWSRLFSRRQR